MITLNKRDVLIQSCLRKALLGEVYTTPKPGLVDRRDTGAHTDMNVHTFEVSTEAVIPGLTQMFLEACVWKNTPESLFLHIREIGKETEKAMYCATGGVNTHKGLIFTLGIINAAAGFCLGHKRKLQMTELFETSQQMTEQILEDEFEKIRLRHPVSHGEQVYQLYGQKGIRGEAQKGFPVLRDIAWPMLRSLRKMEIEENACNIHTLLAVMSVLDDTNVLTRGSQEDLRWLKKEAEEILKEGGMFTAAGRERLEELNIACIQKNISPGGAADYLAAAIFLVNLENIATLLEGC